MLRIHSAGMRGGWSAMRSVEGRISGDASGCLGVSRVFPMCSPLVEWPSCGSTVGVWPLSGGLGVVVAGGLSFGVVTVFGVATGAGVDGGVVIPSAAST